MSHRIEASVTVIFEDGSITLAVGGLRIDALKIASIDEFRQTLLGIALAEITPKDSANGSGRAVPTVSAMKSATRPVAGVHAEQTGAVAASSKQLAEQLREQAEKLRQQHASSPT